MQACYCNHRARAAAPGVQVWMELGTTGFFSNRLFPTDGLGEEKAGWHYVYPVHEVSTCLPGLCMHVPSEAPGVPPPFICRCHENALHSHRVMDSRLHSQSVRPLRSKVETPVLAREQDMSGSGLHCRVHSRRVSTT